MQKMKQTEFQNKPTNRKAVGDMTFAAPSNANESVKVADLAGHLLIITPVEYKTGIPTVHGDAEAIEVNVVDLDTNKEHTSMLWFNVALRNALKTKTGQKVLARIGQGTAKPGKSAPWILIDATGDAAALAKANAYLGSAPAKPAAAPAAAPVDPNNLSPEIMALLGQLGAKPV
jgi:hypothetical protein